MDSIRSRRKALTSKLAYINNISDANFVGSKLTKLLLVLTFGVIMSAALTGAAVTRYSIIIHDENTQTVVYTSQDQPEEILKQQGIELSPHDTFDFSGLEENKATITVNRAVEVKITADESQKTIYMTDGTVAEALEAAEVSVANDDLINVALDEQINDDMNIMINRVEYKTIKSNRQMPFEIIEIPTQTLKKGKTKVLTEGQYGVEETVKEQTIIDGEIVAEETVSSGIIKKSKPAKVLIGDPSAPVSQIIPANPIALDANGNPVKYKNKIVGKATAYSARGKRTKLKPGNVAMNLSMFPKGTQLYIKTPDSSFVYGYSVVRDTGTAVNSGEVAVDLFFDTYKESCLFGAKTVEIYVL